MQSMECRAGFLSSIRTPLAVLKSLVRHQCWLPVKAGTQLKSRHLSCRIYLVP